MNNAKRNETILVDRSLVYSLAVDRFGTATSLAKLLADYSVVAYELAGASALERALRENRELAASKLSLTRNDLPDLASVETDRIRKMLNDLQVHPKAIGLVADYAWSTGAVKYDPQEALSYLVRLLLFCHALNADLVCSAERWDLLCGITNLLGGSSICKRSAGRALTITPAALLQLEPSASCFRTNAFACEPQDKVHPDSAKETLHQRKIDGKVFINYRRNDEAGFAHALYQWLERAFIPNTVFMDVEGIRPGEDFVKGLRTRIEQCDVLLVVIGQRWLDELVSRKGASEGDFVVQEITAALEFEKEIVPVLVGRGQMPTSDQLPDSIRELAKRNAVCLRAERFRADCENLIGHLEQMV